LWVFRYRYEKDGDSPDEGYGMVGSVTWAMFGSNGINQSPEGISALHCCWELLQFEDRRASPEFDVAMGPANLAKNNPGFS